MPKKINSYNGNNKGKSKTTWKMERRSSRGFKYKGNKKQAGNSQWRSGMQEECEGFQGPQRTVAPEEKKEQEGEYQKGEEGKNE